MTRTAIFPGSFNPFTIGHADIVKRGLDLFDEVIIAIGYNEHKADSGNSASQRLAEIKELYADEPRVKVEAYSGLTVDFARSCNARFILRGLRKVADFEYERDIADTNRTIAGIETVFLIARPELGFISSSMVRELSHNGYDISSFLPSKEKSHE